MSRKVEHHPAVVEPLTWDGVDLRAWLTGLPNGEFAWVLAHADDGVIWGKIENNRLVIARDAGFGAVSPPLLIETLQQARVFNERAEWLLWRDGTTGAWLARMTKDWDDGETYLEAIDETHLLWGNSVDGTAEGFSLLRDGSQGLRHAVPLTVTQAVNSSVRLKVRHYVQEDEYGFYKVAASRLVALEEQADEQS